MTGKDKIALSCVELERKFCRNKNYSLRPYDSTIRLEGIQRKCFWLVWIKVGRNNDLQIVVASISSVVNLYMSRFLYICNFSSRNVEIENIVMSQI